ncbi:unnamed protein product [Schistosoma mattheei]|uniref:Uncharacterized protein n=1 Tax=Schistosoma mattheei TaxID=31246 RepID=A0A183NRL3_9TREM|nr:unnamed protein product [Schistosoma mattheei]
MLPGRPKIRKVDEFITRNNEPLIFVRSASLAGLLDESCFVLRRMRLKKARLIKVASINCIGAKCEQNARKNNKYSLFDSNQQWILSPISINPASMKNGNAMVKVTIKITARKIRAYLFGRLAYSTGL